MADGTCCDNKNYLSALRQLTYDVFFNESPAVIDTIWHNNHCTSFENIIPLLNLEVSDWSDMDEIKTELENKLNINQQKG